MKTNMKHFFNRLGALYKGKVSSRPDYLLELDLGKEAGKMGYDDLSEKYKAVTGYIPLKTIPPGQVTQFDGRGFSRYARFRSGLVAPEKVARETGLAFSRFEPAESMIRIMA